MNTTRRASKISLSALLLILAGNAPAFAIDRNERDPRRIAKAVEDRDRGNKRVAQATMTLRSDSGRERVRQFVSRSMKFGGGEKTTFVFTAPAEMRGTSLLTFDYSDGVKTDDQWLYLPGLKTSKRISAADKSGSFLGSDLTYSDLTQPDTDHYDYALVEASVKVDAEECWVVEARPRTDVARDETGYVKIHYWISKDKLLPIQAKAWVRDGQKLKYIKSEQVEKIDGIWTPRRVTVRTVRGKTIESTTVLSFASLRYNDASVSEAEFSARSLEHGI